MSFIQLDDEPLETFLSQVYITKNISNFGPNEIIDKLELNEIQREILSALVNNDKNIIKKSRQVGCTTILLLYAAYRAACHQETILFQVDRYQTIQFAMSKLMQLIKNSAFVDVKVKNCKVEFLEKIFRGGGSVVFCFDGNHGSNFDALIVDEAVYCKENVFLDVNCSKVTLAFSSIETSSENWVLKLWENVATKTTNYHATYVPWYKDPMTTCDFLYRFKLSNDLEL